MPKKNNRGIPRIPIHGKEAHNAAFLVSIGGLIVNWANNESVCIAMLQLLVNGGEQSATIIWHSHRTSNAKLELVHKLCRERIGLRPCRGNCEGNRPVQGIQPRLKLLLSCTVQLRSRIESAFSDQYGVFDRRCAAKT